MVVGNTAIGGVVVGNPATGAVVVGATATGAIEPGTMPDGARVLFPDDGLGALVTVGEAGDADSSFEQVADEAASRQVPVQLLALPLEPWKQEDPGSSRKIRTVSVSQASEV